MSETHLTGLDGTNPLAFFAALGVQEIFSRDSEQPRLWWSDDVIPHAVVDGEFSIERIADRALDIFSDWKNSPAITPSLPKGDETNLAESMQRKYRRQKIDELKFLPSDIRIYLKNAGSSRLSRNLSAALVTEGSLTDWKDKSRPVKYRNGEAVKIAKPSDLYFTSGQQKFLDIAQRILNDVSQEDLLRGLEGPWRYESELSSLGWDVSDDRVYALAATDPSSNKKLTNPGPEALAVLGMSLHPVFTRTGRTITQGCSGSWKSGNYSWPIWRKPASPRVVKSLLAHAYSLESVRWLKSWGVFRIMNSPIRRSDPGGYGTFGPSEIAWEE